MVEADWLDIGIVSFDDACPENIREDSFPTTRVQTLCNDPLGDVVDCCIRRGANHDFGISLHHVEVLILSWKESEQSWSFACAWRSLQHYYAVLPINHFSDGIKLNFIEVLFERGENGIENLSVVDDIRLVLVENIGIENVGR